MRPCIDFREHDTREHAPRYGALPDGHTPLEAPDEALTDCIAAALALQRYERVLASRQKRESGQAGKEVNHG